MKEQATVNGHETQNMTKRTDNPVKNIALIVDIGVISAIVLKLSVAIINKIKKQEVLIREPYVTGKANKKQ